MNNSIPSVSIITVVFNDVEHIGKTIDNVLKQTYSNIEYIIIDGNSTDGTLDVIKQYDGRVKWLSESDRGIYDAMMKGVNMATGEWLLFRNCGDYFFSPSSIEQLFQQYDGDEGVDFLLSNTRFFNGWGYCDKKPAILTCSYMNRMPVSHPSTFIRRSTQLRYPFHLEYKNSADYCFFVEAFKDGATYRYFDICMALVDCAVGATAEQFDRSLKDNIEIMKNADAPAERIEGLERELRRLLFVKRVKRFIPFFGCYEKLKLFRRGWVKCDRAQVLAHI